MSQSLENKSVTTKFGKESSSDPDCTQKFDNFLRDLRLLLNTNHPTVEISMNRIYLFVPEEEPPVLYLSLYSREVNPQHAQAEIKLLYSILKILELKHELYFSHVDQHTPGQLHLEIITIKSGQVLEMYQYSDEADEFPEICGENNIPPILRTFVYESFKFLSTLTKKYFQIYVSHQNNNDNAVHKERIEDLINSVELEIALLESNQNSRLPDDEELLISDGEEMQTLKWRLERLIKLFRSIYFAAHATGTEWTIEITVDSADLELLKDYKEGVDDLVREVFDADSGWTCSGISQFDRRMSDNQLKSYCSLKVVFTVPN